MPIKIPDSLPATATLESENIFVMTEYRAMHQDIRPLKLLILNLMPTKIVTETQLLRKLSNSPLQVQVELLHTLSHVSQNTDAEHLSSFYTSFDQIKDRNYDGPHTMVRPQSPLFRGFDDIFYVPHSRYTENKLEDIQKVPELELLAVSEQAGVFAVKSSDNRRFFITGHPEYDPETLASEYFRDINKGIDINIPDNYFPNNDPSQPPVVRWRSAGQLFYTNWLNYYVYQTTPYDLRENSKD